MTRKQLILAACCWCALVGTAGFEARLISKQREQLAALRLAADARQHQLERLRREQDELRTELTEAERQLGDLPPPPEGASRRTPEHLAEMQAWLARLKQLRREFEQRPDQRIPEMRLLGDGDWLRLAKISRLDSEDSIRKAMAEIRGAAVARFTAYMRSALRTYVKVVGKEAPSSSLALAPYFEKPIDLAMLERYEVIAVPPRPQTSRVKGLVSASGGVEWLVQNRAAVDGDYDYRNQVRADGSTSASFGPWAWMPELHHRHNVASKSYAEANRGMQPSNIADVIPYFDPPLEASLAHKLIRAYGDEAR